MAIHILLRTAHLGLSRWWIMKRAVCISILCVFLASPVSAAPPLSAYATDIHQTSVSGVSSGGAMAVQVHNCAFVNYARRRGDRGYRL